MKLILNITLIVSCIILLNACAQNTVIVEDTKQAYDIKPYIVKLDSAGYDIENDTLLFDIGYQNLYYGKNDRGNALIEYALEKRDTVTDESYRHWSVQHSKNGNYTKAIELLEKSMKINPERISRYYGWLLLYYYRDYNKALLILEQHDAYTPNFSDAPMGEDVHYLKGLCHMQMNNYQKAIDEFNINIENLAATHGEDFLDVYIFVQKGRCLTALGQYEKAILSYKKAINHYKNCSEAFYFMGFTQLKMDLNNDACISFNTALTMIKKGYKSSDNYVEYFHEIYPQQIEKSIAKNCSH